MKLSAICLFILLCFITFIHYTQQYYKVDGENIAQSGIFFKKSLYLDEYKLIGSEHDWFCSGDDKLLIYVLSSSKDEYYTKNVCGKVK
jgi:hypothetical protein